MGAFADVTFSTVRFKEGYDIGAVDGFLARIDAGAVTADEVEHAIFPTVRFHTGYDVDEVDDYLDTVVARLRGSADRQTPAQTPIARATGEREQSGQSTADRAGSGNSASDSDPVIFFQ
ncbi:cell division protein DivIVA [Bifidobacterium goeldii]|uniref:Cell division protein DivIVA n=2 Tax=Bifidobacterium goeldii TaxID=2306975 RepID=A0A430FKC0_9BIFI|nr:cell division protein DivIVA [Bifidobacterium goeldii]